MRKSWYVSVSNPMLRYIQISRTVTPKTGWAPRAPGEVECVPSGHILIQWVCAEVPQLVFLRSATRNSKAGSLNYKPTQSRISSPENKLHSSEDIY